MASALLSPLLEAFSPLNLTGSETLGERTVTHIATYQMGNESCPYCALPLDRRNEGTLRCARCGDFTDYRHMAAVAKPRLGIVPRTHASGSSPIERHD
jgi:hypothetical protein